MSQVHTVSVGQLPFIHKFVISILQNLEGAFCREIGLRPISRLPSFHYRNDVDKVWNILILFTAQHHKGDGFPGRISPYLGQSFLGQIRREVIIVTLVLSGNWKESGHRLPARPKTQIGKQSRALLRLFSKTFSGQLRPTSHFVSYPRRQTIAPSSENRQA